MKAKDIMTTPVVTIAPDTSVREIAAILLKQRISAVPVVEGERLVGLVSEGDLLRRHEIGTDRDRPTGSWWLRLFHGTPSPADYVKSHATHARDIMTREVITVDEDTPIAEIATVLETQRIKRVPVLHGGRVVGIVSRANLVQALAARPRSSKPPRAKSDASIRRQLLTELERQLWWQRSSSNVIVTGGIVHYWGVIDSDDERAAARVAAENVPGVRGIEDHRPRYSDLPAYV
jgi:CBS domain-containing protein